MLKARKCYLNNAVQNCSLLHTGLVTFCYHVLMHWSTTIRLACKSAAAIIIIIVIIQYILCIIVSECPPGMEYQMCGQNASCGNFGAVRYCRNITCQRGCFCSNGTVLQDGVCVDPTMCHSKEQYRSILQQVIADCEFFTYILNYTATVSFLLHYFMHTII